MRARSFRVTTAALVLPWLMLTTAGADAACAPNNNNPQCASFSLIARQQHQIVDIRQRKSTSIIYLYRVCASHGSFEVRTGEAIRPLGPGDCADLDVTSGQAVTVKGTSEVAAGEYQLLHVSD